MDDLTVTDGSEQTNAPPTLSFQPPPAGVGPKDVRTIGEGADFVRANTNLLPVPLAPELVLHLADEAVPLWQKTEDELGALGLPPPFWAFAWAGGQALARYILDRPETVAGKRVLDLGAGSGLVAIAAAKAGAAHVVAAETDPFAACALALNAAANGVQIVMADADLLAEDCSCPHGFDTVLVGDLFYERESASRVMTLLQRMAAAGAQVLIGDPGRSYLPKDRLRRMAEYSVPVTRDLEDADIKRTAVWTLR